MGILSILRKDLLRYLRNPIRTALLFSIPLMMAVFFGAVFGGEDGGAVKIHVLVWDEDAGLITRFLSGAANNPEMSQHLDLELVGPEGVDMMEKGEASALLHFPKNFTNDYLDGRPVTLEILKNPAETFLPVVAEEGAGIIAEFLSETSMIFRPELIQLRRMISSDRLPTSVDVSLMAGEAIEKLHSLDQWLFPPLISFEEEKAPEEEVKAQSILAFFVPGLAMMGALFLAQNATRDILSDRESGRLKQLLTAPISSSEYIIAKNLSVVAISLVGFFIMIAFGAFAGVQWGPALPVAAIVLTASLVASGTMIFIMSLVRTRAQAETFSTVLIILWCLVGGAFFPLSAMPKFLLPISRFTPVYWAVDAFGKTMAAGQKISAILPNLGILLGLGILFFICGTVALRRRVLGGINR